MQTFSLLLQVATAATTQGPPSRYLLDGPQIFTFLFVMLGPLKLLGAYAHATTMLPAAQMRSLALKASLLATVAVTLGGFIGATMMTNWQIDIPILELTAGVVFFLVALRMVMQPYEAHAPPHASAPVDPPSLARIVFPMVVTPYGIAAVIMLLALSASQARTLLVLGIVVANMALNLLGMMCARWIMQKAALPLQLLGAVLAILQAALALQLVYRSLRALGVV
jgi:multiple antibiotic resistance protein